MVTLATTNGQILKIIFELVDVGIIIVIIIINEILSAVCSRNFLSDKKKEIFLSFFVFEIPDFIINHHNS